MQGRQRARPRSSVDAGSKWTDRMPAVDASGSAAAQRREKSVATLVKQVTGRPLACSSVNAAAVADKRCGNWASSRLFNECRSDPSRHVAHRSHMHAWGFGFGFWGRRANIVQRFFWWILVRGTCRLQRTRVGGIWEGKQPPDSMPSCMSCATMRPDDSRCNPVEAVYGRWHPTGSWPTQSHASGGREGAGNAAIQSIGGHGAACSYASCTLRPLQTLGRVDWGR